MEKRRKATTGNQAWKRDYCGSKLNDTDDFYWQIPPLMITFGDVFVENRTGKATSVDDHTGLGISILLERLYCAGVKIGTLFSYFIVLRSFYWILNWISTTTFSSGSREGYLVFHAESGYGGRL